MTKNELDEALLAHPDTDEKTREALRKKLALSTDRDRDSSLLYEINMLTRKASLKENEFIRKRDQVTLPNKIRYKGVSYKFDTPLLLLDSVEIGHLTVEADSIHDASLVFPTLHRVTIGREVKSVGDFLFHSGQEIDLYHDWSRKDIKIADSAFFNVDTSSVGNVKLHVQNYTGKRKDFNYFKLNDNSWHGAVVAPLEGMTMEEMSRRKIGGVTYEFVRANTVRIVETDEHITLSDKVVIEGNVFSMSENVFKALKDNKTAKTVTLSDIASLPDSALAGWSTLERLEGAVTSVGASALAGCGNLRTVSLQQLVSAGDYAFSNCPSLTSAELPASVERIGKGCFSGSDNLTSLSLPANSRLAHLPDEVLSGCRSLREITLPAAVEHIGRGAFRGCAGLTSVTLLSDKPPKTVEAGAFEGVSASCGAHIPRGSELNYGWKSSFPSYKWQDLPIVPNYYAAADGVNIQGKGSVAGNEEKAYAYATKLSLTASPAEGYRFEMWRNAADDRRVSRQNPYSFTVETDFPVGAFFMPEMCQLSLFAENGRIKSGGGGYAFGTEATVTAKGNAGYHFVKWTNMAGDSISGANPFTFAVKGDESLWAYFAADGTDGTDTWVTPALPVPPADENTDDANDANVGATHVLPVHPADFAVSSYTVDLSAANGRIKAGGGDYYYHTQARVEAEADAGYRFVKWTDATGNSVSDRNPYTFVVTDDAELRAVFERNAGATPALPVLPNGEAGVYYAEGVLHLVNLAGYSVSVSTMKGERVLQFTADGDDEHYPAALPAGVYVLNGAKWGEKFVTRKFMVK
ncbi:hypothetical protein Barb6XT_00850 [Bacteroidales bacterium Barb6XT]|nr:hypothetical protein Barb6XT_00850 [Bacteroidales bacterium Barb6XT]